MTIDGKEKIKRELHQNIYAIIFGREVIHKLTDEQLLQELEYKIGRMENQVSRLKKKRDEFKGMIS